MTPFYHSSRSTSSYLSSDPSIFDPYINTDGAVPMTRSRSSHSRSRYSDQYDAPPDRPRSRHSTSARNTPPPSHRRTEGRRKASSGRHRIWPPPPSVEDEADSLSKEYRPPASYVIGGEVCMRGTIDQDPIIIDVENRERRFVHIPTQTTPLAKREKSKNCESRDTTKEQNPAATPLKLDTDERKLQSGRMPSPYAYTRTPGTPPTSGLSAEFFFSPEVLTPPSAGFGDAGTLRDVSGSRGMKCAPSSSPSNRVPALRPDGSDDSEVDSSQTAMSQSRRTTPGLSMPQSSRISRPVPKRYSSKLSDREDQLKARVPSPCRDEGSTIRKSRHSATSDSLNSPCQHRDAFMSSSPLPNQTLPLPIPSSRSRRAESMNSDRPNMSSFARSSSYGAEPLWLPTARGSPEVPTPYERYSPLANLSSRQESRSNWRSSSPMVPSINFTQVPNLSFSSTGAQNTRSSTNPLSRTGGTSLSELELNSSLKQNSAGARAPPRIDIQAPLPVKISLPYPDDGPNIMMPSHEMFQLTPVPPVDSSQPTERLSDSSSPSPPIQRHRSRPSQLLETVSRQATEDSIQSTQWTPSRMDSTSSSQKQSSQSPHQPVPSALPLCPRKDFSNKYDDWYLLDGNPHFDVCPTCFNEIIRPTPFEVYFRRSPLRPSSVRTRCDFGSTWTRLAWLLTFKRRRQSLDLIYAVADVTGTEPRCPGLNEAVGNWYGLEGEDGAIVPGLAICQRDHMYLQALFPSMSGVFVRLPMQTARICSLRSDSRRFHTYLGLLIEVDDNVRSLERPSTEDFKPWTDLIRSHANQSECKRDRILINQAWHFIPSLPAFIVCEECYDNVVRPAAVTGSDLANSVNRVLMPLPAAYENLGCSCQLYSSRMRRVWERAVRNEDGKGLDYLTRKVRERKEVESDIRRQRMDIKRLLERSFSGYSVGVDQERLTRELDRLDQEWLDWE